MIKLKENGITAKVLLLLSAVIWGSSFFILKNTLDEMPVYFILWVRFLSGAVLLFLAGIKNIKKLNMKYLLSGVAAGVFLAAAYITQTIGLEYTTPSKNAFLTAVYCVLVPFMCWAVTKNAPDKLNIVSAVICFIGIGLVSLGTGDSGFNFMGDGMTLICGIFFAAQMIAVDQWGKDMDIVLFTAIQFFFAFVVCFVCFLCFEEMPSEVSSSAVFSLIYLAVFATVLAFLFMNTGIKYASANTGALILSLESVFGVVFSIAFYPDEHITGRMAVGFVLIFIGIVISETKLGFLKHKKN